MRPTFLLRIAALALACAATACHGAGAYGHAPVYAPLPEETTAATGARDYDPVMVRTQPDDWRDAKVSLFGVVESRAPGPGGQTLLKLSLRRLETRNLCDNEQDDDSCRVTVSDKDFGVVWALAKLRPEDDAGPHSLGLRSLVRVVGTVGQDAAPSDGSPIVHAAYYRHWPNFFYVTRASARYMRQ